MTKTEFVRQFKLTTLLVQELDTKNKKIMDALTYVSIEFDEGDLKNATKHLNEMSDKLIEILES